ncbi:ROK family transcriptional regulator [Mesorhizobium sp. Root157]|uniref:ROK family transcriptional regulator n=1 Tax=Mesorhizobium sp. Root157 TaxID=1736477 RepID=UPI0006FE9857|nr:ROK family transcriptional regulator [Mesorhizobium sp. Root157]KQZ80819.1 ROK family transcriptional regulator [Mesorhizobium sp. Root157]
MAEIREIKAKGGSNQEGTSAHNRRVMIEALRLNGTLSRADLARATGLTKQAVSNIIEELEDDGFVAALEAVRKGRGQPSTPYTLVPERAFAIGLQIDRYVTRALVVDLVGNILVRAQEPLPPNPARGVAVILDLITSVRRQLAAISPQSEQRLVGLGVAMPGPFGLATAGDDTWSMEAWQAYPLLETLAAGTGLNVGLQNDAAACATAERLVGAANGVEHAVCLYIGYGIGAGLILNGELYRGGNGNAGEIGMALLSPVGSGHIPLEHQASLASLYKQADLDPADPDLNKKILAMVAAQDARLETWLAAAAADLRWSIHLVETIFDPDTVIVSSAAPEILTNRLFDAMHPLIPSIADRRNRIQPRLQQGIADPWSIALGAAADPISGEFDPRFSAMLKPRSDSA